MSKEIKLLSQKIVNLLLKHFELKNKELCEEDIEQLFLNDFFKVPIFDGDKKIKLLQAYEKLVLKKYNRRPKKAVMSFLLGLVSGVSTE